MVRVYTTATHCNPLQPTATHYNLLQHTAILCNPLQQAVHAQRWRCMCIFHTSLHSISHASLHSISHTSLHTFYISYIFRYILYFIYLFIVYLIISTPPDPINHVYSLPGKYMSQKHFTYPSVQIFKILFRRFYSQKSNQNLILRTRSYYST